MTAAPRRVLVLGDGAKPRVKGTVDEALPVLRESADVVGVELSDGRSLEGVEADLAFVFGGDGAILKSARTLGDNLVPVCGINLGKLGFLATLTDDALPDKLRAVLRGGFSVVQAMMLESTVNRDGAVIRTARAVNDAVVSRGALSRIASVEVFLDDDHITTYNGDGLIVATPLGSTAHSLSAGGPIVEPGVGAMILTPICPHTLSNRPLVVPMHSRIRLQIGKGPKGTALTVDGQVFQELQEGDTVTVARSEQRFNLVRACDYNYFRTLRDKLGWSGHLVE